MLLQGTVNLRMKPAESGGSRFPRKIWANNALKRGDTTKFIRTAEAKILELVKAYLIPSIFTFIIGYNLKR